MCVINPVPFQSEKPVIAYKVMLNCLTSMNPMVVSLLADNSYCFGYEYDADFPKSSYLIAKCEEYSKGFHAYKELKDSLFVMNALVSDLGVPLYLRARLIIVEVELSELAFEGMSIHVDPAAAIPTYVANKCKFIKILEQPCV